MTLKAWALVDNAGTLIKSFNIATHTKPQTGWYAFTFTNAMASTNYVVNVNWYNNASVFLAGLSPISTTGCTVRSNAISGGAATDFPSSPLLMEWYE